MFSRKGSKVKEEERTERAIRSLLKLPENRRCINCNSLVTKTREPARSSASVSVFIALPSDLPVNDGSGSSSNNNNNRLSDRDIMTCFRSCRMTHLFVVLTALPSIVAGSTICMHNLLDFCLHKLQRNPVSLFFYSSVVCVLKHRIDKSLSSCLLSCMWIKNKTYTSREFTHRVKSISMAKFTAEEVTALQAGGNERARHIYFKEWDSQRNACPDGRLREFIKSVYVDRKYSSESNEKASRLRTAETDRTDERRRADGENGDGSLKFNVDEKRNTGHIRHNSKASSSRGGLPKSCIRFEIVDDRFRDDGGGVKRYDGRNSARGQHSKSLNLTSKTDRLSSLIARPVEQDKAVKMDDPKRNQKTAASSHKNTVEQKMENPESLMDSSQPSDLTSTPVNQQMLQSAASDNRASSETPASQKQTQGPDPNSLEALLFGFSVPSAGDNSELCSKSDSSSTAPGSKHPAGSLENQMSGTPDMPAQPSNAGPSESAFPAVADNLYTKEHAGNDQPRVASTSPDFEGTSSTSMQHLTLSIPNPAQGQSPRVGSELHQEKAKSSGRKELPEDLFTGGFSFASPQVHNWQPGLPHGIGFGLPYYQNPMTMGGYNHNYTSKPTNPFDVDNDTAPVRAPQFPSMAFTHGALPHVSAPRGFLNTPSPAAGSLGPLAPHSPSYPAALSPRSPSFASTLSPGAYMAQQTHMNMLLSPRRHAIDGMNTEGNAFNSASSGYPSANPSPHYTNMMILIIEVQWFQIHTVSFIPYAEA